jgi:heme o synthase
VLIQTLRTYYQLTKPGIVYGNSLTTIGGFLLAAEGHVVWRTFMAAVGGLAFIMASACVSNNYIDRDIDKLMLRTRSRALARGTISGWNALLFSALLGLAGALLLFLYTNLLATCIALFGFFAYVVIYGIGKRRTVHGTVIGSISGAIPPVVGYCAARGSFDVGAMLVFLVLVCWQMPHFYAIALYRRSDYAAAHIPVLPTVKGIRAAKLHILGYIFAFMAAAALLTVFGYTGYTYLAIMALVSLYWLRKGVSGLHTMADEQWARSMFGLSLLVLLLWSALLSGNAFLP